MRTEGPTARDLARVERLIMNAAAHAPRSALADDRGAGLGDRSPACVVRCGPGACAGVGPARWPALAAAADVADRTIVARSRCRPRPLVELDAVDGDGARDRRGRATTSASRSSGTAPDARRPGPVPGGGRRATARGCASSVVQAGTDARLQATIRLEVPRARPHRLAARRRGPARRRRPRRRARRRGAARADRRRAGQRRRCGSRPASATSTCATARLAPDGLIRLRTFNGDVRLAFAEAPADARVMALALNGTVTSQMPLTLKTAGGRAGARRRSAAASRWCRSTSSPATSAIEARRARRP